MAEDIFSCKICFENYDDKQKKPKFLRSCGHTLCLQCIKQLYDSNCCLCPVCRVAFKETPDQMKDNYELIPGQPADAPKYWCQDCRKVASSSCTDKHSIKKFSTVVDEKVKAIKEELHCKINVEKNTLINFEDTLKSILKAAEDSLITRLHDELDSCKKRIQNMDELFQNIDITATTVKSNGDLSLFNILGSVIDNQLCTSASQLFENQIEVMNGTLTVSLNGDVRNFILDSSPEDKVLAYLMSVLLLSTSKHLKKTDVTKGNTISVKTDWMQSPLVAEDIKQDHNDTAHTAVQRDSADELETYYDSDEASTASEVVESARSCREIYVCELKNKDASCSAVKAIFTPYGKVMNCKLHPSHKNGRKSWIAFVEFENENIAREILDLKDLFQREHGFIVKKRLPKLRNPKQRVTQNQHMLKHEERKDEQETVHNSKSPPAPMGDEPEELVKRKLFIQNVPVDFPEQSIVDVFRQFGPVRDVNIVPKNVRGGTPRAFAFLTFLSKESAEAALKAPLKKLHYSGPDYHRNVVLEYRAYYNRGSISNAVSNTANNCVTYLSKSSITKPALLPTPVTGAGCNMPRSISTGVPSSSATSKPALPPTPVTGAGSSVSRSISREVPSSSATSKPALLPTPVTGAGCSVSRSISREVPSNSATMKPALLSPPQAVVSSSSAQFSLRPAIPPKQAPQLSPVTVTTPITSTRRGQLAPSASAKPAIPPKTLKIAPLPLRPSTATVKYPSLNVSHAPSAPPMPANCTPSSPRKKKQPPDCCLQ